MTDFAALDRAALAAEGPSSGSMEARASLALKILATLNLAGVLIAFFPGTTPVAALLVVLFNVGAAGLAVLYVFEAIGLDRNRDWAIAALRPLLILIIVAGVYGFVASVVSGKVRLPFDVVLATWALLGRRDAKGATRQSSRSFAVVGESVPLLAMLVFALPLGGWGGALDVHEADLQPALAVDCGSAGAGLPATISLRYDWSWSSSALLPSGTDIVVVGWNGTDADGHPLYTIGDIPDDATGIFPGLAGYPSTVMADAIAHETAASFRWAIQLDQQRLRPSRIDLDLRRARVAPTGAQPLVITASYIHSGIWRHDVIPITCTW
ncbi:MAG TPA: hypothetical protein VGM49_08910 [Candidatus Limnocylindrales bacterium]